MSILICPVCKKALFQGEKRYICNNNHSFDISKKGYVNLLMSNASKEKRHGDDKAMICARTDFLDRGYYSPLAKEVSRLATEHSVSSSPLNVLECGCGECYYLNEVGKAFSENNVLADLYGMDISKEALPYGKKRNPLITLFTASVFKLPVNDESVDVALSIFAPLDMNEMARVVRKGGCVIKVIPLEEHLIQLKRELYENVYLNRPVVETNESFDIESNKKLEYEFQLNSKEEIDSLFKMTPYYYKTSSVAQEKLLSLSTLKIKASFGICKYIRK